MGRADKRSLTESISKLGDLYTVLQMFVLGAHLQSKRYVLVLGSTRDVGPN
jgi:hypothetical protein